MPTDQKRHLEAATRGAYQCGDVRSEQSSCNVQRSALLQQQDFAGVEFKCLQSQRITLSVSHPPSRPSSQQLPGKKNLQKTS